MVCVCDTTAHKYDIVFSGTMPWLMAGVCTIRSGHSQVHGTSCSNKRHVVHVRFACTNHGQKRLLPLLTNGLFVLIFMDVGEFLAKCPMMGASYQVTPCECLRLWSGFSLEVGGVKKVQILSLPDSSVFPAQAQSRKSFRRVFGNW